MPRIVYLSFPGREISGGIKMIFRHVEALCRNGYDAVVAQSIIEPPHWFATAAPIIDFDRIDRETDIIVFPENNNVFFRHFEGSGSRKFVFCQSQHQIFRGLGKAYSYRDFGVEEIITCSTAPYGVCREIFPDMPVAIIPNYVDGDVFRPGPDKTLQVAVIPSKRPHEFHIIHQSLARMKLPKTPLRFAVIRDRTERETAAILGQSAVFLSLARQEAAGLALLEAMACGCLVAGFTGIGGRDYAHEANGLWAEEDNGFEAMRKLRTAIALVADEDPLATLLTGNAVRTARQYDKARFEHALLAFWERVVNAGAARHGLVADNGNRR